jgi:hypothetical protein
MLGGKEGPVNPLRMARSNPQKCVREQRTKSVSSGRGEFEAPPPFPLTPLTGRDTEFSLLKDRWEQAKEGLGQVVLIVGRAARLGQIAPRANAHAACAGTGR